MNKLKRINFADIDPAKIRYNDSGGIEIEGVIIKAGVFKYNLGRTTVSEWIPEEELAAAGTMSTLKVIPLTNEHPEDMVNAENFKAVTVGFVTSARLSEGKVVADVIVNDKSAMEAILNGKQQLSAGYFVDLVKADGMTPEGERYDYVQTNIRYNHCSLVKVGRCGPDVALRLNSEGNQLMEIKNVIVEEDGKYCVKSEDGTESFGCYATEAEAAERLKEIHGFKDAETDNKQTNASDSANIDRSPSDAISVVQELEGKKEELNDNISIDNVQDQNVNEEYSEDVESPAEEDAEDVGEDLVNWLASQGLSVEDAKSMILTHKAMTEEAKNAMPVEQQIKLEAEKKVKLAIIAKALGVKNCNFDMDCAQMQLEIVKYTKPQIKLEGKSADYIQALLDDSMSKVDINDFWKAKDIQSVHALNAFYAKTVPTAPIDVLALAGKIGGFVK
jgi:hypothetical protein